MFLSVRQAGIEHRFEQQRAQGGGDGPCGAADRRQLRRAVERAGYAVERAAAAQRRHQQAVAERRVVLTPLPDGMAELWALLPADAALALHTALTGLADQAKAPGDERGIDHRIRYPTGPAAAHNLHPLCRRHHHAKTEAGWTYTTAPDATFTWTSPTGHTTTRPPPPQLGEPPPAQLGEPPPQLGQPPPQLGQPPPPLAPLAPLAEPPPPTGAAPDHHDEYVALPREAPATDDIPPF